jgi:PAS domain S-box-containing protein
LARAGLELLRRINVRRDVKARRDAPVAVQKQSRTREGQAAAEQRVQDVRNRGGLFVEAVEATRMPMVVTAPLVADNPIIYANAAFLELCGYEREEVLGQNYLFLIAPEDAPDTTERVRAAMAARHQVNEEMRFQRKDGRDIWVGALIAPMVEEGRVVRHFGCFVDISDRVAREKALREANEALDHRVETRTRRLHQVNARLEEEVERRRRTETVLRDALAEGEETLRFRDFLIREVNHRTKNALQLAISLLAVQAHQSDSKETRDALKTAQRRLHRVGAVHDLLTYQDGSPGTIQASDYLQRLCRGMEESSVGSSDRIHIEVEADDEAVWAPDFMVPLGLIVGEALTNALKHAFPEDRPGRVVVNLAAQDDGWMLLRVADDGIGLPPKRREGSLGLRLIEMLAKQIKGSATVEAGPKGRGTVLQVTFLDPNVVLAA